MKHFIILFSLSLFLNSRSQNNALNFDGSLLNGDDVALPYTNTLDFSISSKFSIEGWFKTAANTAVIYSNLVDQHPFTGHEVAIVNTKLVFLQSKTDISDMLRIETTNSYNDDNWHHFACIYKGIPTPANVNIYVDGILQSQNVTDNTLSGAINSLNEPHIGSRNNTTYFMNGTLDEIRVWGKALTKEEVTGRMNCQLVGNEAGLLAYFNFNLGIASGNNSAITTVPDVSAHNQTGSLTGFALSGGTSNFVASAPSLSTTCSSGTTTAIKNFTKENSISIYPNPGNGIYEINGAETGSSIEVYSSIGQLVYKTSQDHTEKTRLDLTTQNAGIYFLKCTGPSGNSVTKQLIKK